MWVKAYKGLKMIYYKEEEKDKMLRDIKSWVKMGVDIYSVFPVEGGYLFHPNLASIQFQKIDLKGAINGYK